MRLEWLGKYGDFVEKLVHYGNAYAQNYNTERSFGVGASFSASEIQTLEYILTNQDKNQNMAEMAYYLGIPASTFSKNVNKMMKKGLVEKYHISTNRKEIILRVSDFGKDVYEQYSRFAYERLYKDVFSVRDQIPAEYVEKFTQILKLCAEENISTADNQAVLIKVE